MSQEVDDVIILDGDEDKLQIEEIVKSAASETREDKSAQEIEESGKTIGEYMKPRYNFDDLLYFFEVNTWHQRCIRLKTATTVGLGAEIIGNDGKVVDPDNEPDKEDYKALKKLIEHPNPNHSFVEFCGRHMIDYYGTGNAFMEIVRNNKQIPAELYHSRVKNMRVGKDLQSYYQILNSNIKAEWDDLFRQNKRKDKNEMLHLHNYDPRSDYYGVPEWIPAMGAMMLDRSSVEYNIRLFQNDMTDRVLIILQGAKLGSSAKKNLKKFFQNNLKGVENAGSAAVVPFEDRDVEVVIKSVTRNGSEKDAAYTKQRDQSRDETIAAHGVPPRLVGIMAAGQLGGGGELQGQLMMFKETVVNPDKNRFETYFNRIAEKEDWQYRVQFREFDITTEKEDRSFWSALPNLAASGILKPEEAQNLMNLQEYLQKSKSETVPVNGLIQQLVKVREELNKR